MSLFVEKFVNENKVPIYLGILVFIIFIFSVYFGIGYGIKKAVDKKRKKKK